MQQKQPPAASISQDERPPQQHNRLLPKDTAVHGIWWIDAWVAVYVEHAACAAEALIVAAEVNCANAKLA